MKTKRRISLFLMAAVALLAAGCLPEEIHIYVDPAELEGLWQKSDSQVYWRYNIDGTGVTWDASEDITEEESNLTFTWEVEVDELTMIFQGSEGNQAVPKVYTVTAIDGTSMSWKDNYGMTQRFNKVAEEQ